MNESIKILYQGLLQSPASWARVGRGYLKTLVKLGMDVETISPRGFLYDEKFALPGGVREISIQEALDSEPEIGLGFLHPPHLHRLIGKRKVNLFVWESNRVPPAWIDALNSSVDLTIVPSTFTQQALLNSGLSPNRVMVVPYGYDDDLIKPVEFQEDNLRRHDPFTFLSIISPHYRKGIRELLRSYRLSFSAKDNVLLRIKSTYDPGESRRQFPFEIPSWKSILEEAGLQDPDAPGVELIIATMKDDSSVCDLFRGTDVYVQPSWGESFGLTILESLAAGIPAIATGWGGHLDFHPGGDDLLPYQLTENPVGLYEPTPGAQVALANVTALANRLQWHSRNPKKSRQLGKDAQRAVALFTWEKATKKLIEALMLNLN